MTFSGSKPRQRTANSLFLEALEPRVLFSADVLFAVSDLPVDDPLPDVINFAAALPGTSVVEPRFEIIIIDLQTPDYSQLIDDIRSKQSAAVQYQLAFIEGGENGVDKISQILSQVRSVDAVHVLSHGGSGQVQLGSALLNHNTFDQNAAAISGWRDALGLHADLLFYGCDLAASEEGVHLLERLSLATGADVAASKDLTGHAAKGGDWALEKEVGVIEAQFPFSSAVLDDYTALLAVPDITDISNGIALNNDGGNSAYLYATTPIDLTEVHDALTVEVRFTTNDSVTTSTLLSHVTSTEQIELSIQSDGALRFAINGQNIFSNAMDYRLLADGSPHAVSVSWNSEGIVEIYIDGESIDELAGLAAGFSVNLTGTTVLGQNQQASLGGFDASDVFGGVLHDVRIWKEVRSESDIALNTHHKFDPGSLPDTLFVNWQMSALSATDQVVDVVDSTGVRNLNIGDVTNTGFVADRVVANLEVSDIASINDVVGHVTPTVESAPVNIVRDGSFIDHGFLPNNHTEVLAGEGFGGWLVVSGGVEVDTGRDYSPSPLGGSAVDMNGTMATDPGIIVQKIPTVIGTTYQLVFALSGSGTGGETTKDLRVDVAGTSVDFQYEIDPAWAGNNLMWKHQRMEFTATSSVSTLRFESLEPNFWGPVIGDVQVVAIPEYAAVFSALDADNFYDAITDKFYKRVVSGTESWLSAQSSSMATLLNGKPGQLMTIGSAYENDIALEFAKSVGTSIWIGSSDSHAEGNWYWLRSDRPNEQFWQGDTTGNSVDGAYHNWAANDPNFNEDYGILNIDGEWLDGPGNVAGYAYLMEWRTEELALPYTYALLDDAGGLFTINPLSGAVSVASAGLDYVANPVHNITVLTADDLGNEFIKSIPVTVVGLNRSPVLEHNTPTQVAENSAVPITRSQLYVSDGDNAAVEINYSVTSLPLYGRLAFAQAPWAAISSFTQQDVDDGRLVYVNTTSAASDSFQFTADDGGQDGSANITGTFELLIKSNAVPHVSSGIELNSDGGNDVYLTSEAIGVSGLHKATVEIILSGSASADTVPLFQMHDNNAQGIYIGVDTTVGDLVISVGDSQLFSSTVMDYTTALLDGKKHSVAMTWDGADESVVLYVDGKRTDRLTNLDSGPTLDLTSSKVVLGQSELLAQMSPSHIFSGNYYDVRLWGYDRSASDIAHMHDRKFVQPVENLLANWHMDGFNTQNQIEDKVGANPLSVMHATGDGFIYSDARADLNVNENSNVGTPVGHLLVHESGLARNVVLDGDFNDAGVPSASVAYSAGQVIGGWDVVAGSVDILRADGVYSDSTPLGGNSIRLTDASAVIGQMINTEAGRLYQLNYSVAGDFSASADPLKVRTSVGNQIDDVVVSYDPQWNLVDNMMWQHESVLFAADSNAIALEFKSIDPAVVISNVRLTEIPLAVVGVLAGQADMTYDAITNKFYKISSHRTTYDGALNFADSQTVDGVSSRLATIHSVYENAVVHGITSGLTDDVWLGASDADVEGEWQWNYPDGFAEPFWSGAIGGVSVNDTFSNWKSGEPNDYQASGGEDFATIDANGYWNDEPQLTGLNYVVVEWDVNSVVNAYQFQVSPVSGFSIDATTGEVLVDGSAPIDYEDSAIQNMPVNIAELSGESVSLNVAVEINDINEPPMGESVDLVIREDESYSFPVSIFNYTDPESDGILSIVIDALPDKGVLTLDGVEVSSGQEIMLSEIPTLEYRAQVNDYGFSYDSIEFRLRDDGGTDQGGVNIDSVAKRLTFNIISVNDAPSGSDGVIETAENISHFFSAADFGFSDVDGDVLDSVLITSLSGSGEFLVNGIPVLAGQVVTAADMSVGAFEYAPDINVNGSTIAEIEFKVRDSGGVANDGIDLDPVANKIAFSVSSVNNSPSGQDSVVTIDEDASYKLSKVDFGFTDTADNNNFLEILVETLPASGSLLLDTALVSTAQMISVADIDAGKLSYAPASNQNRAAAASFDFSVRDDGGVLNGGSDISANTNRLTFDILSVNDAPSGTDRVITIAEDSSFNFSMAEFPVTDPEQHSLKAITVTSLPSYGLLKFDGSGVTQGQSILAANLSDLLFEPVAGESGYAYDRFDFTVTDSGGVLRGGQDTAIVSNEIVFDVLSVNDAPTGSDNTITLLEDTVHFFAADEFGYSDTEGDIFSAVVISTLPAEGSLWLGETQVSAGQVVGADDLADMAYQPGSNAHGSGYSSFNFRLQDSGGTANGGVDTDPLEKTITIDVLDVNDPPSGADSTVVAFEDIDFIFSPTDFGFSDIDGDNFATIKITTLPAIGELMHQGAVLAAGHVINAGSIGDLTYQPPADASGLPYASFTFQVQDTGGTLNGGLDADQSVNVITILLNPINDAPTGADTVVSINENTDYSFVVSDFGFLDLDNNNFESIVVTSIPGSGSLSLSGNVVVPGQSVSATDIANLVFTPLADFSGDTGFTFKVQDDGGTSNGGVDTATTENTVTLSIANVNKPPSGSSNVISVNEDQTHEFEAIDFGFGDADGDSFTAIIVSTLPAEGMLSVAGTPVFVGQVISVADLASLLYLPAAEAHGVAYTGFDFAVQDSGGTANGGIDTDPTVNTIIFDVKPINDAPAGKDNTITLHEDSVHPFVESDFGFTDPEMDGLAAVIVTTLPGAGSLWLAGTQVTTGQVINASNLSGMEYRPETNSSGTGYASFNFRVQDDGGVANGGIDTNPFENSITINVVEVNDPPSGTDATVVAYEDVTYGFSPADFGFTDTDADYFATLTIKTLPLLGELIYQGVVVVTDQVVNAGNIVELKYQPPAGASGLAYVDFKFQVQDTGGTANGGVDADQSDNVITIDLIEINDAPSGADSVVLISENTSYSFVTSDFGFNDTDNNSFDSVVITGVPGAGTLSLSGSTVVSGQSVSSVDIPRLVFTPTPDYTGDTAFTFKVQDDGGTANGGDNTDAMENIITLSIANVSQPPSGTNKTIGIIEDQVYVFDAIDFGFRDVDGDDFISVTISSVPAQGVLSFAGTPVTTGQIITIADPGSLTYAPDAEAHGAGYADFDFAVRDSGGTENGGANIDPTVNTITFDVLPVNDAPKGASGTFTLHEDSAYRFTESDFGFNDREQDSFTGLQITLAPGSGRLELYGHLVVDNQLVAVSDIPGLTYSPAAGDYGLAYDQFAFKVVDSGGAVNGGQNTSLLANSITLNVLSVNDAPSGTSGTIAMREDESHVFSEADFGFTDLDQHKFTSVTIDSVPAIGSLSLNDVPVVAGQSIAVVDLAGLTYTPVSSGFGSAYAQLEFSVQDDGGNALGGSDTDPTRESLIIDVLGVNDAPSSTDVSIVLSEDSAYTFAANDFEYNDIDGNGLKSIVVSELPVQGLLTLAGVAVQENQSIAASEIDALVFTPEANGNGAPYSEFSFRVQDDGGRLNGGQDTDSVKRVVSIEVAAVNDAPVGVSNTVNIAEDSEYVVSLQDFGYSDIEGDGFLGVSIEALPVHGELLFQGTMVPVGDLILAIDIASGALVFHPYADVTGPGTMDFRVHDAGGLLNGGADTDVVVRQLKLNVTNVGDAPEGTDGNARLLEDTHYTLTIADFGYRDLKDNDPMESVIIDVLPEHGFLRLDGFPVTVGQSVPVVAIQKGFLQFVPAADSFTDTAIDFRVVDSSLSNNTDLISNRFVLDIESVSDAPQGQDKTVQIEEDIAYEIKLADFGFSDGADNDAFTAVVLSELPLQGSLLLNGFSVVAGQEISTSDIESGRLVYEPVHNDASLLNSLGFYVMDDGDLSNAGQNKDEIQRRLSFDIVGRNDAPLLTVGVATLDEGDSITLTSAELFATDVDDSVSRLIFTVAEVPRHGEILVADQVLQSGDQFSLNDIVSDRLAYRHDGSESELDDVLIRVADGGEDGAGSVEGRLVFNIVEVIDAAPQVTDDQLAIAFGDVFDSAVDGRLSSGGVSLLDNDSIQSEKFLITLNREPSHGTIVLHSDGTFSYQHDGSQYTTDDFSYKVTNEDGMSSIATVEINVEPPVSQAFGLVEPPLPVQAVTGVGNEGADLKGQQTEVEKAGDQDEEAVGDAEYEALISSAEMLAKVPNADVDPAIIEVLQPGDVDIAVLAQTQFVGGLEQLIIRQHNNISSVIIDAEQLQSGVSGFQVDVDVNVYSAAEVIDNQSFQRSLGLAGQALDQADEDTQRRIQLGSDAAVGASISVSAGALAWVLRGGSLAASMMAATPLWSSIDPFRLARSDDKAGGSGDDVEGVEQIFD